MSRIRSDLLRHLLTKLHVVGFREKIKTARCTTNGYRCDQRHKRTEHYMLFVLAKVSLKLHIQFLLTTLSVHELPSRMFHKPKCPGYSMPSRTNPCGGAMYFARRTSCGS